MTDGRYERLRAAVVTVVDAEFGDDVPAIRQVLLDALDDECEVEFVEAMERVDSEIARAALNDLSPRAPESSRPIGGGDIPPPVGVRMADRPDTDAIRQALNYMRLENWGTEEAEAALDLFEACFSEYEQALRQIADMKVLPLAPDWPMHVARAALSGSAGPDEPKADTGGRGFPASSGTALASQVAQCVDAAGEAHERGDTARVYEQVRNIAWLLLAHDTEPGLSGSAGSGP